MTCAHEGFHAIRTKYDQPQGVLIYFWTCERCGARLGEAHRLAYRPTYEPNGNGQFSASQRR
jgi:hypothetical protein